MNGHRPDDEDDRMDPLYTAAMTAIASAAGLLSLAAYSVFGRRS